MQGSFFDSIRKVLSYERLDAYRRSIDEPEEDIVARYVWNTALCEALYPLLQNVEIALRNSIHSAATDVFQNDRWFEATPPILNERDRRNVADAANRLAAGMKPASAGRIVAELNFGFWTGLLHSFSSLIAMFHLIRMGQRRQIRVRAA